MPQSICEKCHGELGQAVGEAEGRDEDPGLKVVQVETLTDQGQERNEHPVYSPAGVSFLVPARRYLTAWLAGESSGWKNVATMRTSPS